MVDDGLAVIAPPSIVPELDGRRTPVTPLRLGELPAVLDAVAGIDAACFNPDDEMGLAVLVLEHSEAVFELLVLAARLPRDRIEALSTEAFFLLLVAVLEVNRDLFRPDPASSAAADSTATWADTLQMLIGAGHSLDAVRGYTLAQVRGFARAVARARRIEARHNLLMLRAAQQEPKAFKAVLRDLDRGE